MINLQSKLTLRRAIWNTEARRSILNKGLKKSAEGLEEKLKENIDNSTPAGRLYSRGVITARRTKANRLLKSVVGTKTRVVTGYKYHKASSSGQPPARDTSTLYRSIRVRRIVGKLSILASVKAPGVLYLDSQEYLNRLFFEVIVVAYYQNEFNEEVKRNVQELMEILNSGT